MHDLWVEFIIMTSVTKCKLFQVTFLASFGTWIYLESILFKKPIKTKRRLKKVFHAAHDNTRAVFQYGKAAFRTIIYVLAELSSDKSFDSEKTSSNSETDNCDSVRSTATSQNVAKDTTGSIDSKMSSNFYSGTETHRSTDQIEIGTILREQQLVSPETKHVFQNEDVSDITATTIQPASPLTANKKTNKYKTCKEGGAKEGQLNRAVPLRLGNRYDCVRYICSGAFGAVFKYQDRESQKYFAVKYEFVTNTTKKKKCNLLKKERDIYKLFSREKRMPKIYYYEETEGYSALVLDLFGMSLGKICNSRHAIRLKYETVLDIAVQLIEQLEIIHKYDVIHRDIKPDNIVLGLKNPKLIYLIDFGLAKMFDRESKQKNNRGVRGFVGSKVYAPINAHLGVTQCKKDDLEAAAYVLISLRGGLPWRKFRDIDKIGMAKMQTPIEKLCTYFPECQPLLKYCRKLNFNDDPDYDKLKRIFLRAAKKRRISLTISNNSFEEFDWTPDKE
ncbi:casein kinase I-like [Artemia franciscana]|uniref:casein kinase I-like n=1 Tax=Artemia franciscana TaxID=6661 RepID=UPI0032DA8AD8